MHAHMPHNSTLYSQLSYCDYHSSCYGNAGRESKDFSSKANPNYPAISDRVLATNSLFNIL